METQSLGLPEAVEQHAAERCAKLRALMAPSERYPYGQSSNALATELGVHLTVFIQFLNNGGLPQKVDPKSGEYTTAHLRLLAGWIDEQPEPPPPKLGIIREGSESRANSCASSRGGTPRGDRGSDRKPTPLDPFLASIDDKLLVYGDRLVKLGVTRAGDLVNVSLQQLTSCGVKKLHARRLKSDPVVFLDAQQAAQEENSSEDAPDALTGDLEALLAQADSLGLSGPELAKARAALEAQQQQKTGPLPPTPQLLAWLGSLHEPKLEEYAHVLASLGVERPGHLSDLTISDLTNAGVKKLHARRLKSEPAVYHDAIAIEDAAARGGDSAMMNAGTGWFGGVAEGDDEDDDDGDEASYASRGNRASHNSVELDAKLEALLAEAEAMGMSGKELDAAREVLLRAGTGA